VRGQTKGAGFSLIEVLVALVVLHVSLLGAFGLLTLATGRLANAVVLEDAAAVAEQAADSLSRLDEPGSGESVRGAFRIVWETAGEGGLVLRAWPVSEGAHSRAPLVELRVP
jgi:prepilin-type N-terminal cleavage/methylation domain-containing protein